MYAIKLKSIRGLLGIYTLFFAGLLFAVPLLIGFYEFKKSRQTIEKELSYILHLQGTVLNTWFETTSTALAGISGLSSVDSRDFNAMLHDFQRIVETNPSLDAISFADSEGNILLDTSFGIRKAPYVQISDRLYFLEAKEKRPFVSNALISRVTGKPIIVFSHPVLRGDSFVGVIFYSVRFDTMVKLVKTTSYGDTGRFSVVDRTGLSIESERIDSVIPWAFPDHLLTVLSDEGLHRYTGRSGKTVLGSAMSISKRNFLIVAEMDEWENLKPFIENGLTILLVFGCLLFTLIWMSIRSYSRVDNALKALYEGIAGLEKATYGKINAERLAQAPSELKDLAIAFNSMVDTIKKKNEALLYQGFHDAATDLYNRQYYEEEIKRLSTGRFDPIGVFICDINGLKLINDTLGHQAGDELLRNAAAAIQSCFRKGDLVARIGGDEFAILITKTNMDIMELASQRLKGSMTDNNFRGPAPLSFAFGYAWGDTRIRPLSEIIAEADDAMYAMKEKQRGAYRSEIIQYLESELSDHQNLRRGHMKNCERIMKGFAEFCHFPQDYIEMLVLLARYHDIGFVGISHAIANKKDRLSPEEFREVRRHPEIGYRIALIVPDLKRIAEYIRVHHFWYNGEGYPPAAGEKGIPVEARIMRIVDAFVAMTMDRTYRESFTKEEALEELKSCSGTEFDPELVNKFSSYIDSEGVTV